MASNAATTTPGRMARVIHWLFPSRRHVAITPAADTALTLLGLPLWMHLALTVVFHVAFRGAGGPSES